MDVPAEQVALDTASQAESVEATRELTEAVMARAGTAPVEREEIVFIDAGVEDADALRGSVPASAEIIELHAGSDGMAQIAAALADRRGIDAIHILSHGDAGELQLGNATLSEVSMRGEHADALSVIAAALSPDADVLIYGCDFGADARGASAVETFKELTGADIAASDDDTGHVDLGGDWDLEVERGAIETQSISAEAYQGVLTNIAIDGAVIQTAAGGSSSFSVAGSDGTTFTVSRSDGGTITGEAGGAGLGRDFGAAADANLNASEDYTLSITAGPGSTDGLSELDLDIAFINNNIDGAEEIRNFQVFDTSGNDITSSVTFAFADDGTPTIAATTRYPGALGFIDGPVAFDETGATVGTARTIYGIGENAGDVGSRGVLSITSPTAIGSVTFTRITTELGQFSTGAFGVILQGIDYTVMPAASAPTIDTVSGFNGLQEDIPDSFNRDFMTGLIRVSDADGDDLTVELSVNAAHGVI
ncbi:MAG: DUF4347 domain-containing protein, partial [Pseudomonadota bacterium]